MINYLNNLTQEQRKDLRGYFGGGADTRFWRAYQKAIAEQRTDFSPAGLEDYWLNKAKQFNQDSLQYIIEIKRTVKELFSNLLETHYGKNWLINSLPKPIYNRAKNEADEHNYDLIKSGSSETEATIWDFVTLSDCKLIATSGSHWTDIFEKRLTRPEEEKIMGGKEAKTEWLVKIETIANKLQKTSQYSVSAQDFELLKEVRSWLCQD